MGRRSDHSREELREIIVAAGHRHMEEVGFAHFSAREVAKRIGYSIGTIYNVFGSYDALILAINGRTLALWRDHLRRRLAAVGEPSPPHERLAAAITAYFEFATGHRHAWAAIYDFRLPEDCTPPPEYQAEVRAIFDVVVQEVRAALTPERKDLAEHLTRSLLATVHGHCVFAMNGTFTILAEPSPVDAALQRVKDAVGITP